MAKTKENKKDFFWLSYSDLMTSLFFVMLVLFVLVYSMQSSIIKDLATAKEELDRIREIEKAVNNIDKRFFIYNDDTKKHILAVRFLFPTGSSNINQIIPNKRPELIDAGKAIKELILKFPQEDNIKYLVVVEGQASKDNWNGNDKLSYDRAQSLINLWKNSDIGLEKLKNCELVIAGSGEKGIPRTQPDVPPANQRFLITIIPKIGELKKKSLIIQPNSELPPDSVLPQISIQNKEPNKLVIYQPIGLKYYFTQNRPSFDTDSYLSVAAAFTTPQYDIDGVAIENGIIIKPEVNKNLNGCCIISPSKIEIFECNAENTSTYIQMAQKNKSSFFQQMLLIKNSSIINCPLFGENKDFRRALVELDNSFSIIESIIPMSIKTFQEELIAISSKNAIYLDMGSWSEGWYREGLKKVKIGHNFSSTDKQRSWIVFKKN